MLEKTKADVADKQQSSTLEVDNNVILDAFTMSKREMAGCQFTGGKIVTPILGRAYKYENGLKVFFRMPATGYYLVVGLGENIIAVKASKDYLDDSLSFATGATYLKAGLFKYIGEIEFTNFKGEPKNLYCFEAVENSQGIKSGENIVSNNSSVVTNQFIGKSLTRDEISLCVTLVRNALYEAWDQPERNEAGSRPAKLYIRLDKSGRISNYRITQSSGSPNFDMTVLKAPANCPAIRGLSAEFLKQHDELTVEFKLE